MLPSAPRPMLWADAGHSIGSLSGCWCSGSSAVCSSIHWVLCLQLPMCSLVQLFTCLFAWSVVFLHVEADVLGSLICSCPCVHSFSCSLVVCLVSGVRLCWGQMALVHFVVCAFGTSGIVCSIIGWSRLYVGGWCSSVEPDVRAVLGHSFGFVSLPGGSRGRGTVCCWRCMLPCLSADLSTCLVGSLMLGTRSTCRSFVRQAVRSVCRGPFKCLCHLFGSWFVSACSSNFVCLLFMCCTFIAHWSRFVHKGSTVPLSVPVHTFDLGH